MFQKKDFIYSETLGVCQVENITTLTVGRNEQASYYVLRPVFAKEETCYIPVKGHQVVLREMFTFEEAEAIEKDPNVDLEKDIKLRDAVDFVLRGKRN